MSSLISVVIANYNGSKWIKETLSSVVAQTYNNFEVIIVDDKSTDNSIEIITPFLADSRFKLFKLNQNQGSSFARNYGIEKASGEFIALLDSDDILFTNAIETNIKEFTEIQKQKPNLALLMHDALIINEKGKIKGRYITKKYWDKTTIDKAPCWALQSTWFFKKNKFLKFLDEDRVGIGMLFVENMKAHYDVAFIGTPTIKYRICMYSNSSRSIDNLKAQKAANETIKQQRWNNPVLPSEVSDPTYREQIIWSYGRAAKAAYVNERYIKTLYYSTIVFIFNPFVFLKRSFKYFQGKLSNAHKK